MMLTLGRYEHVAHLRKVLPQVTSAFAGTRRYRGIERLARVGFEAVCRLSRKFATSSATYIEGGTAPARGSGTC